jgi:uncharacterized membrane protein
MNPRLPTSTLPESRWPNLAPPSRPRLAGSLPRPHPPGWMRKIHWRTAIGALLLAGILHVGATLAVPLLGPGRAYQKLRELLPANTMVVVAPGQPGKQLLPFLLPDAFYGICRYSIASEPITVSAPVADLGWTLSLHTPHGENFYVMPGQQQRSTDISLVIVPAAEKSGDLIPAAGRRAVAPAEDQIASPSDEGLIVIRAPLRGQAWKVEAEAVLSRAKCTPGLKP